MTIAEKEAKELRYEFGKLAENVVKLLITHGYKGSISHWKNVYYALEKEAKRRQPHTG